MATRALRAAVARPDVAVNAIRRAQAVMVLLPGGCDKAEKKAKARLRTALRRVRKRQDRDALDRLIRDLLESDRQAKQTLLALRSDEAEDEDPTRARYRRKDTAALQAAARAFATLTEAYREAARKTPPPPELLIERATALTKKRAVALTRAMLDAGSVYSADRLRLPRRLLRKLRTAAELLKDLGGIVTAANLRAFDRTLLALDRIRDLQRLINRVRKAQGALSPAALHAWHELDLTIIAIEHRCRRQHARYVRECPALLTLCESWEALPAATGRPQAG
ncbi:MAG: hypothetical protein LBQ09_10230 [Acidobacteriaceae bacterium]|nr:hypothetical protein [Acidobacteriaceae bacterium]